MRLASIQRSVHRNFRFANNSLLDLRCRILPTCSMDTSAEYGGLFQEELKSTQKNGVQGVRFDRGRHRDTVTWAVASVVAFDDKAHAVLSNLSLFGLTIYWPGSMEFMLVNYDGCNA